MWNHNKTPASSIALGGVLAAASVVVMCLGGLIPIATYVCPVVAMLVLQIVFRICGSRIAWAWYGAVALLSLLMCPDKEAAFVFLFIGYYPIVKPAIDRRKCPWIFKALLFNLAMVLLYWILLHLTGMAELQQEFSEMGTALILLLLVLGNVTFFMLDLILGRRLVRRRKNG